MSISNFIKIPKDLHRDYIKHALAGSSQKYKYWSFKPKGTSTGFLDQTVTDPLDSSSEEFQIKVEERSNQIFKSYQAENPDMSFQEAEIKAKEADGRALSEITSENEVKIVNMYSLIVLSFLN